MVKGKRICQLQMLVGLRTRERSSVTERLRGSGGGEEARGNRHTLHHPCAAFVLVMLGSHFDLQLSLLKYRAKGSLTSERDASTLTDLSVTNTEWDMSWWSVNVWKKRVARERKRHLGYICYITNDEGMSEIRTKAECVWMEESGDEREGSFQKK